MVCTISTSKLKTINSKLLLLLPCFAIESKRTLKRTAEKLSINPNPGNNLNYANCVEFIIITI
nr:MAG TPA: hypothetical protein [Caudoviricetes sp.]